MPQPRSRTKSEGPKWLVGVVKEIGENSCILFGGLGVWLPGKLWNLEL